MYFSFPHTINPSVDGRECLGFHWDNWLVQGSVTCSWQSEKASCRAVPASVPRRLNSGVWTPLGATVLLLEGADQQREHPRAGAGLLLGSGTSPNLTSPVENNFPSEPTSTHPEFAPLRFLVKAKITNVLLMWLFVFHFLCWFKNVSTETFCRVSIQCIHFEHFVPINIKYYSHFLSCWEEREK